MKIQIDINKKTFTIFVGFLTFTIFLIMMTLFLSTDTPTPSDKSASDKVKVKGKTIFKESTTTVTSVILNGSNQDFNKKSKNESENKSSNNTNSSNSTEVSPQTTVQSQNTNPTTTIAPTGKLLYASVENIQHPEGGWGSSDTQLSYPFYVIAHISTTAMPLNFTYTFYFDHHPSISGSATAFVSNEGYVSRQFTMDACDVENYYIVVSGPGGPIVSKTGKVKLMNDPRC